MDFRDLMSIAVENTSTTQKKIGFNTELSGTTKKDEKKGKGIQSAAVRKFLERQELDARKKENAARRAAGKRTERSDSSTDKPDEAPDNVEELFKKSARVAHNAPKALTDEQKRAMQEKIIRVARGLKGLPTDDPEPSKPKESSNSHSAEKKKKKIDTNEIRILDLKVDRDKDNKPRDKHKDSSGHGDRKHRHKHKKHKHDKHNKDDKTVKLNTEKPKEKEIKKPDKPKIKKRVNQAPPPALNFSDLLKLAETKQHEPILIKPKEVKKEERPLTQEEKDRVEFRKSKEYKQWFKHGTKLPTPTSQLDMLESKSKSDKSKMSSTQKETKNTPSATATSTQKIKSDETVPDHSRLKNNGSDKSQSGKGANDSSVKHEVKEEKQVDKRKEKVKSSIPLNPYLDFGPHAKQFNKPGTNSSSQRDPKHSQGSKMRDLSRSYDTEKEHVLVCGPSAGNSGDHDDARPRDRNPVKEESPWDRIYNKVHKEKARHKESGKHRIESDEEDYDDDLDDFVVDDEEEMDTGYGGGYSKYISEIFGYDKNKYRDMDDDVDDMEVGFAQQMAEEKRSAKMGKQEDLEDIRREEMHKKRKMMVKKQAFKKMRR